MAPNVVKLLTIALLLSTVHAGYKRIRKKIIIYVPEVTKVVHHKHVAKVVVPQIIYKDFKPSKDYGVELQGNYGPYAFEHVGKGYGSFEHGGAGYDYGGKGYAGSEIYGGFSHEKGDVYGSASSHRTAYGGHGANKGVAPHGSSFGNKHHASDWKGDVGASAYSAYHPQYTPTPTFQHREVVVRYGQPPKQPPVHSGWTAATSTSGAASVRRQAARTSASTAGVGGGGGGWVKVGGVEVARGTDVLAGA